MIATQDIQCTAARPAFPLMPMVAFKGSPSSVRVIGVPKTIGSWTIDAVSVKVLYPDSTVIQKAAVRTGSVWVATLDGCDTTGKSELGYTIYASGKDEDGNDVNGYVLGKGDVEILDDDGSITPGETVAYVKVHETEPQTKRDGDMWKSSGVWYMWLEGKAQAISEQPRQVVLPRTDAGENRFGGCDYTNALIGSLTNNLGGQISWTGNGDAYARYKLLIYLDGVEQTRAELNPQADWDIDGNGNITLICPYFPPYRQPLLTVEGNPLYIWFNIDGHGGAHPMIISSQSWTPAPTVYAAQAEDQNLRYWDIDFKFTVAEHEVEIKFSDELKLITRFSELVRQTMTENPSCLDDYVDGRIDNKIPGNLSAFNNDVGYITDQQVTPDSVNAGWAQFARSCIAVEGPTTKQNGFDYPVELSSEEDGKVGRAAVIRRFKPKWTLTAYDNITESPGVNLIWQSMKLTYSLGGISVTTYDGCGWLSEPDANNRRFAIGCTKVKGSFTPQYFYYDDGTGNGFNVKKAITLSADEKSIAGLAGGTTITCTRAGQTTETEKKFMATVDELAAKADSSDIHDATITLTQGGVTKGSFTVNQSSNATIDLDAGGGGGTQYGTVSIAGDVVSQGQSITHDGHSYRPTIATDFGTFSFPQTILVPAGDTFTVNYDWHESECAVTLNGTQQSTLPTSVTMAAGDNWAILFNSCLAPDTLILMADGSLKMIADVQVGDKVATPFGEDTVTEVYKGTGNAQDKWVFENGAVLKTIGRHRFYNCELGEPMYLEAWNIGEHALTKDGAKYALCDHEHEKGEFKHCTLFTEKWNLYYANGMLAGNRRSRGYEKLSVGE